MTQQTTRPNFSLLLRSITRNPHMVDSASLRRTITEKLSRVQDLGNGIFRGERIYQGKTFATAYIDLSDSVIQRAANLAKFQEGLLGSEFFTADGDQRW